MLKRRCIHGHKVLGIQWPSHSFPRGVLDGKLHYVINRKINNICKVYVESPFLFFVFLIFYYSLTTLDENPGSFNVYMYGIIEIQLGRTN